MEINMENYIMSHDTHQHRDHDHEHDQQQQQINCLNQNQIQNMMEFVTQDGNYVNYAHSPSITTPPESNQQSDQHLNVMQNNNEFGAQVHTIMLNGQPALFIPASSSNLLCQMLLNSSQTSTQNTGNQLYEIMQTQSVNNDLTSLLAAANALNTDTSQEQQQQSDQNNVILGLNGLQYQNTNQSNGVTYIQIPTNMVPVDSMGTATQMIGNELICFQLNQDPGTTATAKEKKARKPRPLQRNNNKKIKLEMIDVNKAVSDDSSKDDLAQQLNSFMALNDQNTDPNTVVLNGQQVYEQQWGILGEEVDAPKRPKRKPCECPNCLSWKELKLTSSIRIPLKRTHKCHKCTKEYNKTSHLVAHLRAHDNYRPYVCDFVLCNKTFTRSDELKRHRRIHTDDRNYPCEFCDKKFLRKDHLTNHQLIHNKPHIANSEDKAQQKKTKKSKQLNQMSEEEQRVHFNQILTEINSLPTSSSSSSQPSTLSPTPLTNSMLQL